MGRGALVTNLFEGPAATRRRGPKDPPPSKHWAPIWGVTPLEAQRQARLRRHFDGSGGGLPRRFRNHYLLWWTLPQRDQVGTMHSRFVTVGRRREETADGVRYEVCFWFIETRRKLHSDKDEVTSVKFTNSDLYMMVRFATKKIPGSRVWTPELQEEACDDAAQMIAHRLNITPLYGCDGVKAALVHPARVENDAFDERAQKLRKKKAEWHAIHG